MSALRKVGRPLLSGDSVLPIVLTVMGGYWVTQAFRLGIWNGPQPGSGMMPLIYGALLVIFSVAVLFFIRGGEAADSLEPIRKPFTLVGMLMLTVLGFPLIGGTVALFLMMSVMFVAIEHLPAIRASAISAILSVIFYFVFDRWLSVALPHGPWGF